MYDTRFKGSFKAVPIYVYKPCSIRKRTLGSISCNTTTSRPLRLIPSQLSAFGVTPGLRLANKAIAPHWSSSYPEYLSSGQNQEEQQRVVWSRLHSHRANLASRLKKQKERYLALRQELNPRMTQVESSHEPLFCDRTSCQRLPCQNQELSLQTLLQQPALVWSLPLQTPQHCRSLESSTSTTQVVWQVFQTQSWPWTTPVSLLWILLPVQTTRALPLPLHSPLHHPWGGGYVGPPKMAACYK